MTLADGGGIYTQGLTGSTPADGEKLIGNVIFNQFGSGAALYTDNGCCNVTAVGNVLFHTNFLNWGGRHRDYYPGHNGQDYDAFDGENNYWEQGDPDSSVLNITLKGNHLISRLDQAPASILRNAGLEPAYQGLLRKQFGSPSAPEPPSRVAAAAGNGFAYVSWNPPVLEGGAPVQSYTVTSSRGDRVTCSAAEFWDQGFVRVTGLSNGADYTFTVTASNTNGASAASLPSRPVGPGDWPISAPSAPLRVSVFASDGAASIHFQAPQEDGGSPITAYSFTVNPGGRQLRLTGRTVLTLSGRRTIVGIFGVIDGLRNGQSYTVDVAAVNAAGEGASGSQRW